MEKDLRDAYKALSLVRADLVATRKAKTDLEDQWRGFVVQQRAQDAQRSTQLAQLREAFRMREEDFHAQLLRIQATAEEHENDEQAVLKDEEKGSVLTESEDGEPEREDHQQQSAKEDKEPSASSGDGENDNQTMVDIAKDHMTLLASVYALRTQVQQQADQLVRQDASFSQERNEWSLLSEAMQQQITNLKESKVDLVREKKFMDEKFEFLSAEVDVVKSERDELREHLRQWEQRANLYDPDSKTSEECYPSEGQSADLVLLGLEEKLKSQETEKQSLTEQYEKRVDALSKEKDCLQRELDAQRVVAETLTTDLEAAQLESKRLQRQMHDLKSHYENEQKAHETSWREEKANLTEELEESIAVGSHKSARIEELLQEVDVAHQELAAKQHALDDLAKDRTDLIQQLQQINDHSKEQLRMYTKQEEDRTKTQLNEREKLQQELTALLASFESATAENAIKMSSLQRTKDALQQALIEKSHLIDEMHVRDKDAQDEVKRLQNALLFGRQTCDHLRKQLQLQRNLVLELQGQMRKLVNHIQMKLSDRLKDELSRMTEHFKRVTTEFEQKLAESEVDRSQLEGELKIVQDAARTLQRQLDAANIESGLRQKDLDQLNELRSVLEAKDRELVQLTDSAKTEKEILRVAHEDQLGALQSVHDKALHQAMIEQNALAHEMQKLKLSLHRLEHELKIARDAADAAEESLKLKTVSQEQVERLEVQLSGLEIQLMSAEDCDRELHELSSVTSWKELSPKIRQLDDFLPQLQLFAGRLQTSLHLCAENAQAMQVLSSSSSASPSLLPDIIYLVRLADQWKQLFDVKGLALHVRLVRRSVLATLAQWFEEGAEKADLTPAPPPPFGIDSQEVAIILQNWTADVEKQKSVSHWLKRIASGADAAADVPRDDQAASTLELKDMTREVKDAFSMLIVPLLKQNRSAFVRVFTRRVCDIKSSYSPDETCWEMRIHVQFSNRQSPLRRPESLPASTPTPALRRISSSSSVSSVGSATSSVASSLSLSSISSASKLQIIQARLQQMQQQNWP